MEEWEDELQAELSEKVNAYLEKGLTMRQVFGVLETLKAELMPHLMYIEDDEG